MSRAHRIQLCALALNLHRKRHIACATSDLLKAMITHNVKPRSSHRPPHFSRPWRTHKPRSGPFPLPRRPNGRPAGHAARKLGVRSCRPTWVVPRALGPGTPRPGWANSCFKNSRIRRPGMAGTKGTRGPLPDTPGPGAEPGARPFFVGSPGRGRAGAEEGPRPSGQKGGVFPARPGPPRAGEAECKVGAAGKAAHAHRGLRRVRITAHARVGGRTGSGKNRTGTGKGRIAGRGTWKAQGKRGGEGEGRRPAERVARPPRVFRD